MTTSARSSTYRTLLFDAFESGVACITLNRPEAHNAYTFQMTQELVSALKQFADDDALRVLLLTGAGNKAFCTGGDIVGVERMHRAEVEVRTLGHAEEMRAAFTRRSRHCTI